MSDSLTLIDAWGDRFTVDSCDHSDSLFLEASRDLELDRAVVAELRDYLTEWLGDQSADVQQNPDAVPTCCAGEDSSTCCPTVRPASILEDAQAAVYGDREGDYGHPREDFTRQAILYTGLLQHKLAEGAFIDAEDIPRLMIATKLARDVHSPKRDNRVDGAGYFLTLDRLETGR